MAEQGLEAVIPQETGPAQVPEQLAGPPLAAEMRADAAAKAVLLQQLGALTANEAGARAGLDPECLHDFRVAVRRTRTALGQIRGVFPKKALERFRSGFAWLGEVTGPTRDLDVYLLHFPEYQARLPEAVQGDLQPLHAFLKSHRQKEQAALVETLDSHRYRQLLQGWRAFLEAEGPAQTSLVNALRPVREVAGEQIARAYRRVVKQGKAITKASPATDLHRLRKSCKKLRYLLEFFQPLYPPKKVKKLIKALKRLQENLGAFQDLEVQGAALRQFGRQMVDEEEAPAATLLAMGMLVASLGEQQQRVRKEFKANFSRFRRGKNRRRFDKLFPPPRKTPPSPA
jgi:CHAD domain-containing protein